MGVVVAVLLGAMLVVLLQPGPSGSGGTPGIGQSVSVHGHGWGVNTGLNRSAPNGPASIYSHTYGIVGSTSGTGPGGPISVYSHASAVSEGPTTTTPSLPVPIGSAVFVFVGYVNGIIGGGAVSSVTDSLGDAYSLVTTTGFAENHSEDLYVAEPMPANASLTVSVNFSTGATTVGGSVAVVDVNGSQIPFVDGAFTESGAGSFASVSVTTNLSNDLLLYGLSGQAKDTPFSPTSEATLLDTGNGTSGPFEDGEGFATYSATEAGTSAELSATLAHSAVWNAIGVGLVGCDGCFAGASTTTAPFHIVGGSAVFVFVGYANSLSGGSVATSVTDSLGDSYSIIATTGLAQNHTEELYVAEAVPFNATVSVTVTFSDGARSNGGSVGVVDVTGSGTPFIDGVYHQSGFGDAASVSVSTNHSNDLLLLGLSGPAEDTAFAPTSGETLLDTINDTGAPAGTAVGFATYSYSETGGAAELSANLANPGVWNAIGVGIVACSDCASGGSTTTSPVSVAAGSSVFVFVGFVNPEIGGGDLAAITDSAGDSYSLVTSTGYAENHTESLFVSQPIATATTLTVSVTMSVGATTMGCAVAAVDVVESGTLTIDGVANESGDSGLASVTLVTDHANDFVLLGVSGQEKDAPFAPGSGETLLDTAGNTTGPFDDGMGFATFWAIENGTTSSLSATLENSAVWNAIAVGISSPSLASVVFGAGGSATLPSEISSATTYVARVA
ncbi:MAG: hypothetical protein ABSA63_01790 [Thermoplasmata archaeon]